MDDTSLSIRIQEHAGSFAFHMLGPVTADRSCDLVEKKPNRQRYIYSPGELAG